MTFELRTATGATYKHLRSVAFSRSIDELVSILDVEMVVASSNSLDLSGLVSLYHNSKLIFTGYCFADSQTQGDETQIKFQFRSKTANLARCMHLGVKTFSKTSLKKIIDTMINPFGVKVSQISRDPKIERFVIDSTDTVFDSLDKLVKDNGLLMVDTPSGDIAVIERNLSSSVINLDVGKNVQSFEYSREMQDIFSEIHILSESEKLFHKVKAADPNAIGYSPLVIKAAKRATLAELQALANFEVAVRAARSTKLRLTLPFSSWFIGNSLPDVNRQVNFTYQQRPDLNGLYMIKSMNLNFSEGSGHAITLELAEPDEFLAKPEIPKRKKGKKVGTVPTLKIINP